MRFFESLRKRRDQIRVDLVNPANLLADYFAGAMYAHLFKDDENARGAAFTAGVVSSSLQRSGMIVFVQQLSLSLKSDPDMKDLGDAASREVMASKLDILAQQLSSRDWTNGDRNDARRHLERIDPEYGRAMSGGLTPSCSCEGILTFH